MKLRGSRAAWAPVVALGLGALVVLLIAGGGLKRSVALAAPTSAPSSSVSPGSGSMRMTLSPGPPPAGVGPLRPARGVAGAPLRAPAVYRSRHGVLKVKLVASTRVVTIAGRRVVAKVYNGSWVAPTLSIAPGDLVEITLVNHLHEPTNLHFHGLEISPGGHADNIFVTVNPGRSFRYRFRLPRDAPTGTFWYHSHLMVPAVGAGRYPNVGSEEQVFDGLSGLIEVRGLTHDLPASLRALPQRYLALRDVQVHGDRIVSREIDSDAPTTRLVDGQYQPRLTIAPGQTQLWHVANIGADIFYRLSLPGSAFEVIAQDGHPVIHPQRESTLVLPPGKRWDVLVTGAAKPGASHFETLPYDQGDDHYPRARLATVVTRGAARRAVPMPRTILAHQLNLLRFGSARPRTIVFSENPAGTSFSINGRSYDPRRIDFRAQLGTVQQWTIVNHTDEQHPFHLHTYPMQAISVNGVPLAFNGYQDEIVLPIGGYVVVRVHFVQFTGLTVFHCHILAHEDTGMMANLLVTR
ncbi:MAG: multicopper oxidase family protein [Solirubrobacteraceae bacterium]